jgi:hypothetical protein
MSSLLWIHPPRGKGEPTIDILLSNYIHRPYLEKLAGQAHETAGASSTSEAAPLALHVHLQSHFRSGVDGGLLVTGLHKREES